MPSSTWEINLQLFSVVSLPFSFSFSLLTLFSPLSLKQRNKKSREGGFQYHIWSSRHFTAFSRGLLILNAAYDPLENVEEWVMEEDDSSILDYDELENMIYNDKTMPICQTTQKEGGTHNIDGEVQDGEGGSLHIGSGSGGIDLESIGEENDDSYGSENDFREHNGLFNADPPRLGKNNEQI